MSRRKASGALRSGQGVSSKKWPLLATGAAMGVVGAHADAGVAYTPLNITLDTLTATKTATITLKNTGLAAADNKPAMTFTASTTNGVLLSKPNVTGSIGPLVITGTPPDLTPTFSRRTSQSHPTQSRRISPH